MSENHYTDSRFKELEYGTFGGAMVRIIPILEDAVVNGADDAYYLIGIIKDVIILIECLDRWN